MKHIRVHHLAGALLLCGAFPLEGQGGYAVKGNGARPATRSNDAEQVASAAGRGSSARVSMVAQDSAISRVLRQLVRQAGMRLVYDADDPRFSKLVSVRVVDAPVMSAVRQVLEGTGLAAAVLADGMTVTVRTQQGAQGEAQQSAGSIQGKVTDSISGKGIPGATVAIQGTRLAATASDQGAFVLRAVPSGKYTVTVRAFGYRSATKLVTVEPEKPVNVFAVLGPISVSLNEVVTTAIGDRKRIEVGNAIATINADSIVSRLPVRNLSDLLTARVPGVVVSTSSGLVGAPSKIRMRGINSPVLNNDPIVIVDGVRLQSQVTTASIQSNLGATGVMQSSVANARAVTPSRIDDIDPNTIESIDVLRGPSASSLYGTEAANGVIIIKTKRGRPGPISRSLSIGHGVTEPTLQAAKVFGLGNSSVARNQGASCRVVGFGSNVSSLGEGTCVLDTAFVFSPQLDSRMRTLANGSATNIGVSVSGGSETLQQFLSVSFANNMGPVRMSEAEERRLLRQWGVTPPRWMRRPNQGTNASVSTNTNLRMSPRLQTSLGFSGSYSNTRGGGTGLEEAGYGNGITTPQSIADTLIYFSAEVMRSRMTSAARTGTGSLSTTYQPVSWLTMNGTVGGDYSARTSDVLTRERDCTLLQRAACAPSEHRVSKNENIGMSVNVGMTGSFNLVGGLRSRTSVGEQYSRTKNSGVNVGNGYGTRLGFGTDLLSPPPIPDQAGGQLFTVQENRDESITAGWYISQQFSLYEQLFFDVGFRQDVASAFGRSTLNQAPSYPKYSASWAVPGEMLSRLPWITSLRLRSAFGHAGQQARQEDVLNQFEATQWRSNGAIVKGVAVTSIGNPDLRPERGTELEGGFDLSLFAHERVQLAVTMYRKLTKDQIVGSNLPKSYGIMTAYGGDGTFTQLRNIGSVVSRGGEATVTAKLFDSRSLVWNVSMSAAKDRQKLLNILDGAYQPIYTQFKVGYPLFSYFGRKVLSYSDQDGNGYLALREVTIAHEPTFFGPSYPKVTFGYNNQLSLWGGLIGVSADIEHVIGSTTRLISPGLYDRNASLARQAGEIEALVNGGYTRETDYVRLRNVGVSWRPPTKVSRMLRTQSIMINLAGTNLGMWTNYVGRDPNVETSPYGLGEVYQFGDNGTGVLQPRSWSLSVNLGF